jgi:four helix bundle protein
MMKYQRFDELPAWQEAARLYQKVLDLLEDTRAPFSASYRGQLERAALAVSNHIAESRDRMSAREAVSFLADARAAATEVQSLVMVIGQRPKVARLNEPLQQIRTAAESCTRQLTAWMASIENGPSRPKEESPSTSSQTTRAPSRPDQKEAKEFRKTV